MTHDRFGPSFLALALAASLGAGGAYAQTTLDGEQPAVEPATELGVPTENVPASPATPEQLVEEGSPSTVPVEVEREPSAVTNADEAPGGDAGTAQALADDGATDDADADEANAADATETETAETETAAVDPAQCEDQLAALEGEFGTYQSEAEKLLAELAVEAPLILQMADGSVVDMRAEDDIKTGPVENWFGDPPVRSTVRAGLEGARGAFDSGDAQACLDSLADVRAAIEAWETAGASPEAMGEDAGGDGGSENAVSATAADDVGQSDESAPATETASGAAATSADAAPTDGAEQAPASEGVQFETVPVAPAAQ